MWCVYILKCKDDTFYTGSTSDISRRVKEHNAGRGARYTRTRTPVCLAYLEPQEDRSSAMKREAQIKTYTKKQKEALVLDSNGNPPSFMKTPV